MKAYFLLLLTLLSITSFSQNVVEHYQPLKKEMLRIGTGANDFMPYIQSGYTLMLPDQKVIKGVLIFLEDSGYDKKNKSAKQLYPQASEKGFAVLSVSTEIPFDFYFTEASMNSTHKLIQEAFKTYNLPNDNVFLLGASLVGHRALQYIKHFKDDAFQLNIKGIVICNFTLDFTRKWHQHQRDIKINRINLWEPKFINYMLETYLKGTPKTAPENYHNFSPYSYFDEENRNIKIYKDYAVRAYIEPSIKYRLTKYYRTLYENNATDMVGFLAELQLVGNENTDLIVLRPEDNSSQNKNAQATWDAINKDELMDWINLQSQ
ncbi:MAG: hypothetical protein ED556_08785 [Winogradskyella sp.]|uniref:hypothetical protein n=1 Tax=Winogradskyella sp. TaxID=1883156 RepID=UPI000F4183CF|nr:hypothetical protein [Winogradskyella sp.]RNC86378.1 MAG: hypothetical protein ED556_08785 [Winogradskyella sp.]